MNPSWLRSVHTSVHLFRQLTQPSDKNNMHVCNPKWQRFISLSRNCCVKTVPSQSEVNHGVWSRREEPVWIRFSIILLRHIRKGKFSSCFGPVCIFSAFLPSPLGYLLYISKDEDVGEVPFNGTHRTPALLQWYSNTLHTDRPEREKLCFITAGPLVSYNAITMRHVEGCSCFQVLQPPETLLAKFLDAGPGAGPTGEGGGL